MATNIAIIGAGVSGLTCGVVLAESGNRVTIVAAERGRATTSAAAAAIWFPYDTEAGENAIGWALTTYDELRGLTTDSDTGVSMIELRCFTRAGAIEIPSWAGRLGVRRLNSEIPRPFSSGFALEVPLTDTSRYLDYLERRFVLAGGYVTVIEPLSALDEISGDFDLIVNCAGFGARALVPDAELEPHRGQIAIVPRLQLPYATVCDGPPLMYVIPRASDCVFGGTNEITDDRAPDSAATARIVAECSHVLNIDAPRVIAERVGIRPFRRGGVCLRDERISDGRRVIHNYGHGGAGFTLSWACARRVAAFAAAESTTRL
jgi:D-amino-acid oxidase